MAHQLSPQSIQASVLFLRIPEFAGKPVLEQAKRRDELNATVSTAASLWGESHRVVLDAEDGAAIVGLSDPANALQAALQAVASAGDLHAGLHWGVVQVVPREGSGANLLGEGIDAAGAVASAASPGTVLASKAFCDALSASSPRLSDAFRTAGESLDPRLGRLELHAYDAAKGRARQLRRNFLGAAAVLGILGIGVGIRISRKRLAAANRPAVVNLEVRPWAEVYLDGELKGTSPPLVSLSIKPGEHTLELRNGKLKPLKMEVNLKPGEELQLEHAFAVPVSRPAPARKPQSAIERARDRVKSFFENL